MMSPVSGLDHFDAPSKTFVSRSKVQKTRHRLDARLGVPRCSWDWVGAFIYSADPCSVMMSRPDASLSNFLALSVGVGVTADGRRTQRQL
jgi:hypothetical protein